MEQYLEFAAQIGWPATAIFLALRAYKEGWLFFLPGSWAWNKIPKKLKSLLPWWLAIVASLVAMLTGISAPVAVATSLAGAGLSIGSYLSGKKTGELIDGFFAKQDPQYEPSKFRKAASIVVPINKEFIKKVSGQP